MLTQTRQQAFIVEMSEIKLDVKQASFSLQHNQEVDDLFENHCYSSNSLPGFSVYLGRLLPFVEQTVYSSQEQETHHLKMELNQPIERSQVEIKSQVEIEIVIFSLQ